MRVVVSLYRWRRWLGPLVMVLVLSLLMPHWVMAGEPCEGSPTPVAHVEIPPTGTHTSAPAAFHHHLDHEHSHDVGAVFPDRRELGPFAPAVHEHSVQALLLLPVAFVIDRPPRG